MVNPRKAYPVDPGLIPVFDRSGKANVGHALETVVALDFERRGAEVTYVRTDFGHEVDFLARSPDGRKYLIQGLPGPGFARRARAGSARPFGVFQKYCAAELHIGVLNSDVAPSLPQNIHVPARFDLAAGRR